MANMNEDPKWAEKLAGKLRVLVVGDSWASAVVAGGGEDWATLLGIPEELQQAVPGSTAAQWAADFEGRLTRAAQTPADAVVVSLVGNDFISAMGDNSVSEDELLRMCQALETVVEKVRKRQTLVLLYADPYCDKDPRVREACVALNAAILSVCRRTPGVMLLDTGNVLRPEHFDGVDIHPNAQGQKAIAGQVAALLQDMARWEGSDRIDPSDRCDGNMGAVVVCECGLPNMERCATVCQCGRTRKP